MNKPRNIPDEFKQGWDPMEEREHPAQTKALTKGARQGLWKKAKAKDLTFDGTQCQTKTKYAVQV